MKPRVCLTRSILCFLLLSGNPFLSAQTPMVNIEVVEIGDAGNVAASANSSITNGIAVTTVGQVTNVFYMGRYEVTISQYVAFLNAIAGSTNAMGITAGGLTYTNIWNHGMTTNGDPSVGGIHREDLGGGNFSYSVASPTNSYATNYVGGYSNLPIMYSTVYGAAAFANWVNNGAHAGSSATNGSYNLNSGTPYVRQPGAVWYLPNLDEWYKAAYYAGGSTNAGYWLFPTQTNGTPGNATNGSPNQANYVVSGPAVPGDPNTTPGGYFSNSPGAYGTFDMAGNAWEWIETPYQGTNNFLGGGSWFSGPDPGLLASTGFVGAPPLGNSQQFEYGFRLASAVPEASSAALLIVASSLGSMGYCAWKRFRKPRGKRKESPTKA